MEKIMCLLLGALHWLLKYHIVSSINPPAPFPSFSLFILRLDSVHEWDECEHPSTGWHTVWEDGQHQLGGCLQVAHHHTPSDGLRQWGRNLSQKEKGNINDFCEKTYLRRVSPPYVPWDGLLSSHSRALDGTCPQVKLFIVLAASEASLVVNSPCGKHSLCKHTVSHMLFFLQRFIQYLASRNTLFNLSNFLDKSGLQGILPTLCKLCSNKLIRS